MPKLVRVDNFDRDGIRPYIVAENLSDSEARLLCNELNRTVGPHGAYFYVVKPNDYWIEGHLEDWPGFIIHEGSFE